MGSKEPAVPVGTDLHAALDMPPGAVLVDLPPNARTTIGYIYDSAEDILALAKHLGATVDGDPRYDGYAATVRSHPHKGRWIIAARWGDYADRYSYSAQASGPVNLLDGIEKGTALAP